MILSGHQPCYLPSLQLFAKMNRSNIFMHRGDLQYLHGSWHSRNYILLRGKRHLLSIPIQRPHIKPIRDAWFADQKWKKKHLETIALAYGEAPYFDAYYPILKEVIYRHTHSLEQLNIELTWYLARWLDINVHAVDSANWHFNGDAVDTIIQSCQAVGADRYLSNEGARSYLSRAEEKRLEDAGIWHQWMTWVDPDDPEPLSAIHHLFHLGPKAHALVQ